MAETAKPKLIAIGKAPSRDVLSRLDKLEDAFISALQEIRAVKSELQQRTGESTTLERLLTVDEVAKILGETETHVYQLARGGKLPAIRVGKYWKFVPSALQKWLEQNQND
jgi:excisionase family DNA binding protein